jgi:protein-tyrosine phosphatase
VVASLSGGSAPPPDQVPRLGLFGKSDAVEVVPGLYIGSAPDRRSSASLARAGVTHVIDLRGGTHDATGQWPNGVAVECWGLAEYEAPSAKRLKAVTQRTVDLLNERGTVLVHCREGVQRAPMVACAVLIETGWSLGDAYRLVSSRRPVTAMSEGQLRVLREVERDCNARAALATAETA